MAKIVKSEIGKKIKPEIGHLVFYKTQAYIFRPCFAIAVGSDFAGNNISLEMRSVYGSDDRKLTYEPTFIFRIGNSKDLNGKHVFDIGYAFYDLGEIEVICSVFNHKEFKSFIEHLGYVNKVFASEPSRSVSIVRDVYDLFSNFSSEIQQKDKLRSIELTMYGELIKYFNEQIKNK